MSNLTALESLQQEAEDRRIRLIKSRLPKRLKGLYYAENGIQPIIVISKYIQTRSDETYILAEEIGHYYTSSGNLLSSDMDKLIIAKQENKARRWAVRRLISLQDLIKAYENSVSTEFELAEYLDVTEEFLNWSIDYYKKLYGTYVYWDDVYTIYFDPFHIEKDSEE